MEFLVSRRRPRLDADPDRRRQPLALRAPDPNIDPTITPRTTEWRVGLGLDIPIWKHIVLGTLVQYRADQSNVAAFTMHDLSVSAGPTYKF